MQPVAKIAPTRYDSSMDIDMDKSRDNSYEPRASASDIMGKRLNRGRAKTAMKRGTETPSLPSRIKLSSNFNSTNLSLNSDMPVINESSENLESTYKGQIFSF